MNSAGKSTFILEQSRTQLKLTTVLLESFRRPENPYATLCKQTISGRVSGARSTGEKGEKEIVRGAEAQGGAGGRREEKDARHKGANERSNAHTCATESTFRPI